MASYKKGNPSVPKVSRHDEAEFGPGKKGLILCGDCGLAYFKKSWHHKVDDFKSAEKSDVSVKFSLCPACKLIQDKQYEGRVILQDFPMVKFNDLCLMVKDFGNTAYHRDPLDRVIAIKKVGEDVEITTTENQMAVMLGKKIEQVFRASGHKISYAADPGDVAIIRVTFGASE